ncbi:hypothetical protein QZH41_003904 [Actinostola sp. cb2023]|nr:hypothetical protein QZH41_003904 [Actinostola sp. cb2023]
MPVLFSGSNMDEELVRILHMCELEELKAILSSHKVHSINAMKMVTDEQFSAMGVAVGHAATIRAMISEGTSDDSLVDESSRNDQTGEDEAMVLDGTSQPPNSDLNPNSAFDDANECLDRDEAAKDVPSPTLGVAKVGEEYSTVDFCEHTLNIQYENHKESSYSEVIIRTVSSSIAQCYDHNSFENPFIRETAVDDYDPLDNGYTVSGISNGHASFLQEVFNPTNDDPNETVSDVSFVFPQANHTENGPLILHSPSEVWGYDNNKLILGVVTSYHNEPEEFIDGTEFYLLEVWMIENLIEGMKNQRNFRTLWSKETGLVQEPDDYKTWLETMDTEFPGRFKRLFAGPMWSGCDQGDIGYTLKSIVKYWQERGVDFSMYLYNAEVDPVTGLWKISVAFQGKELLKSQPISKAKRQEGGSIMKLGIPCILVQEQNALQFVENGHNLLVTGQAGTGKSHLVKAIVDKFREANKVLAQECNFANPDEHLIDALIFGTNSDQVRSKLLKEPADMTFNKAIDIARTEEATKRQIQGEYHIVLDETVPPVVHPPRRIPEALRKPFKAELDSLCAQEILKKVDKPTDWVNSFVCVTKPNGSIRLCLDPKDLNKATKRPHHYTPTLEDILAKLNGAKYFSIVDARSGYWNIKLDEESSYYTTFNSPFGRYRFCRLPFGLICAQDVFQKKVDETFGDLTGVTGIADDIVVVGFKEDGSDHDTNLQAVMERARSTGLKFNPDKCVIKSTSIPFYGHILSANGLKVDPSKVEAINALDPSSLLPDLQSFLGATQYLSRFIPHMASVAAPLWDLVKKSSEFVWSPEHQAAVDKIKQAIAAPTSLKYFDSKKPVVVQVDASQRGLGAVLLQDNQPLAYSSKLLTDTERRYSNIEREMLGVVHGLEKFHYYCYGRPVVVQTDHKPLEAISKKHLASAPPRIARMLLRIQKYNAQVTYIPGKDIPLADALSRISPCPGDEIPGLDVSVHELHLHLNATPTRLDQIRDETAKDIDLALLRTVITNGWPKVRSECPSQLHAYWNYRDELTVADGIILKGLRIIIPKTVQVEVLNQLHYGHQGSEKCKLRAKGSVFWPNINQDIDIMVKQCAPCQRHQKENTKEPMIPHDVPQRNHGILSEQIYFTGITHTTC